MESFCAYLKSDKAGTPRILKNMANRFTNDLSVMKELPAESRDYWETALVQFCSAVNFRCTPEKERQITIEVLRDEEFTPELKLHSTIPETAFETEALLVGAISQIIGTLVEPLMLTDLPKINLKDSKLVWNSKAVTLVDRRNYLSLALGCSPNSSIEKRFQPSPHCFALVDFSTLKKHQLNSWTTGVSVDL